MIEDYQNADYLKTPIPFSDEQPENTIPIPPGAVARDKWRSALDSGFQTIPNVLFRCQRHLGLDAVDVVILLNITMHWWQDGTLPHPRPSVIAQRMKVSTRTVERRIIRLQKNGFLTRLEAREKKGKSVRPFDLSGLVHKLESMSAVNLIRRRATSRQVEEPGTD